MYCCFRIYKPTWRESSREDSVRFLSACGHTDVYKPVLFSSCSSPVNTRYLHNVDCRYWIQIHFFPSCDRRDSGSQNTHWVKTLHCLSQNAHWAKTLHYVSQKLSPGQTAPVREPKLSLNINRSSMWAKTHWDKPLHYVSQNAHWDKVLHYVSQNFIGKKAAHRVSQNSHWNKSLHDASKNSYWDKSLCKPKLSLGQTAPVSESKRSVGKSLTGLKWSTMWTKTVTETKRSTAWAFCCSGVIVEPLRLWQVTGSKVRLDNNIYTLPNLAFDLVTRAELSHKNGPHHLLHV